MIKKVFILIIIFIVFYEIYLLYLDKPDNIDDEIETISNDNNLQHDDITKEDNIFEPDPLMFGEPVQYDKNNIIIWSLLDPHPWSKVVYKYYDKNPFYFYIKIKIPSLNDYSNWKEIIPNIDFDPKTGELIISSQDEETALSIVNLIISNFKGDLSLEEILDKNLIKISINKARKYEIVKHKLIEQITTNLNSKPKELFNDQQTLMTDLAQNNHESYVPYEGSEYSFI